MKKQGIWVKRFLSLILFVFVMSFMGYHVVNALTNPVGTVSVTLHTVEITTLLDGWFVRDEIVLPSPTGVWELQAETGQRFAKGDTLALTYRDTGALSESLDIHTMSVRLAQLEAIDRSAADPVNVGELDSQIQEALLQLLSARDADVMYELDDLGAALRALLYKRVYTFEGDQNIGHLIEELTANLEEARERMGNGVQGRETAPVSGIFCDLTDGFEDVLTTEKLDALTVEDFISLTQSAPPAPSDSMGRLATGFTWRYAAIVPREDLGGLTEGLTLVLRVDKTRSYKARVRSITPGQDGLNLLVLEGDERLAELVSFRQTQCEILWDALTGLRIPREAIRLDEQGRAGVYCLVFSQQLFKPVDILIERDNYYLAAYTPGNPGSLLPGDEVIVRGKNLYDGKVVR